VARKNIVIKDVVKESIANRARQISSPSQNFRPFYRQSSSILSVDTAFSDSNTVEDNMGDDETLNDATSLHATTSSPPLLPLRLRRPPTPTSVDPAVPTRSALELGEDLRLALDELCQTINGHHSLQEARILSMQECVQLNVHMPPHRYIVVHIERDRGAPIWLRLDRHGESSARPASTRCPCTNDDAD
jgi:hypothetical protein